MRKIEKQMLAAIKARKDWTLKNTGVFIVDVGNPYGPRAEIYLHGNHLADYWYRYDALDVDERTLARWPSVTTKSRLRALGVDVYTRNHITYLDGQPVN